MFFFSAGKNSSWKYNRARTVQKRSEKNMRYQKWSPNTSLLPIYKLATIMRTRTFVLREKVKTRTKRLFPTNIYEKLLSLFRNCVISKGFKKRSLIIVKQNNNNINCELLSNQGGTKARIWCYVYSFYPKKNNPTSPLYKVKPYLVTINY